MLPNLDFQQGQQQRKKNALWIKAKIKIFNSKELKKKWKIGMDIKTLYFVKFHSFNKDEIYKGFVLLTTT